MNFFILLALFIVPISTVCSQKNLPVIQSGQELISIRDGARFKANGWRLAPESRPDVYRADLIDGKPHLVTFITDLDSISFVVEEGKRYDFIIRWKDQDCFTRILGQRFVPAAVFDANYQRDHKGKTFILVPPVYELVNIAIALTTFGRTNKNFVYHHSPYYAEVQKYFKPYLNHPLILKLDSLLSGNSGHYANTKMNGYAFEFDDEGKIRKSPVYDRTGFRFQRANSLHPYQVLMQSFADESDFLGFYEQNRTYYESQISFYRDSLDIGEMKKWLDIHFPGSNDYDTYKIIFSPLVSYNQSSTWFESNGFRELQPHVNFPYRRDLKKLMPLSREAEYTYRGNIVFTEINHGYINPEGDKYADEIRQAISNRNVWVDSSRSANYYGGNGVFNEYMNWGLVVLRIMDYVPHAEQEKLIRRVVRMMVKNRDFIRFESFSHFLITVYRNKDEGQTLTGLYPQIISWFDKNNRKHLPNNR